MHYQAFAPSPALPAGIRCLWTLQDEPSAQPAAQRVVPDGCVELVLNIGDRFRQLPDEGAPIVQPSALVVADARRPMVIAPTGRVDLIAIRFEPGGASQFLGATMPELMDGTFDLAVVNARFAGGLLEQLAEAGSAPARARLVEDRLLRGWRRRLAPDPRVLTAARIVASSAGRASLDTLTRQLGVSNRWLQRQFKASVGFGPKLLGRLTRFQSLVAALEGSTAPHWARLAAHHGYFDQSHLIRDFRRFAGTTPGDFLREPNALNTLFARS